MINRAGYMPVFSFIPRKVYKMHKENCKSLVILRIEIIPLWVYNIDRKLRKGSRKAKGKRKMKNVKRIYEKEKAIYYGSWGNRYYRTESGKVFQLESGYSQGCFYYSPSGKTYYLNSEQTKKIKERIEFIEPWDRRANNDS